VSRMMLHCDKCGKKLSTYLYGSGGVEEKAVIIQTKYSRRGNVLPDIICNECWGFPRVKMRNVPYEQFDIKENK